MALPKKFNRSTTADEVLTGVDLSGKRIIVTGANTGIGYETARALASAGATVVLACRNITAGNAASQRIRDRHAGADVHCQQWVCRCASDGHRRPTMYDRDAVYQVSIKGVNNLGMCPLSCG